MLKREDTDSVTILILNSRLLKNVNVHQKEALVREMDCLMLAKASASLHSQTAMAFFLDSWEIRLHVRVVILQGPFQEITSHHTGFLFFFQNGSVEDTVYFLILCLFTTHLHTHAHMCALTNAH